MDDISGNTGNVGLGGTPPILPGYPGPAGQPTPGPKNSALDPMSMMFPMLNPKMRSIMFPLISRLFK